MHGITERNATILVEANDTMNTRATVIADMRGGEFSMESTTDKGVSFFIIVDLDIFDHAGSIRNEVQSRELIPKVLGHSFLLRRRNTTRGEQQQERR